MKTIQAKIYEAEDGKQFTSQKECSEYETIQKEREAHTSYWSVYSKPDLTEGRGYYELTLLSVYCPSWSHYSANAYVMDWCFKTIGSPLAFVMGASATENWTLTKIDKASFQKKEPYSSVGDYKYPAKKVYLTPGKPPQGLIVETTA